MRLIRSTPDKAHAFYMAHEFLKEYDIHWLPVNPYEIIDQADNWQLKYVHILAQELGETEDFVLQHVMRSKDGLAMYDVSRDQYDIIINSSDLIPPERMLWTVVHEIGHIYLGHLRDFKQTKITKEDGLTEEEYNNLEFEADMFAGEVLASKWLMSHLNIVNECDITLLTGISDDEARIRYKKATESYDLEPANVKQTLNRFEKYMKEVTVCRPHNWFDLPNLVNQNRPHPLLHKPKPPFSKLKDACQLCGNEHGITSCSNYCIACGNPLRSGIAPITRPCKHVNLKEAAFCEKCGNRVYRIRQGFCFEECEI